MDPVAVSEGDGLEVHHLKKAFPPGAPGPFGGPHRSAEGYVPTGEVGQGGEVGLQGGLGGQGGLLMPLL